MASKKRIIDAKPLNLPPTAFSNAYNNAKGGCCPASGWCGTVEWKMFVAGVKFASDRLAVQGRALVSDCETLRSE